jgi:mannose-6-phosphate isomerase-like protein (cupin superfamily)
MKDLDLFIESGILEIYVLGLGSAEEVKEVEEMAALHKSVRKEIEAISETLKIYAESKANAVNGNVKPMLLASIDYEERLKSGEQPGFPPILNEDSTIQDYTEWLNRKDMVMPDAFNGTHVKIIGYTPEASTAIVWIQNETPYEVHTDEHEKFLIVEGTCDIDIDGTVHSLVPGNYLGIPLHAGHVVKVTSKTPCKLILQRVAA